MTPEKIKIEFLGKCPKKVELPIPLVQKSEKTGEVLCNPIGEFPYKDGMSLLAISGEGGLFKLVGKLPEQTPEETKSEVKAKEPEQHQRYFCQCCDKEIPWKKHHINLPPKFLRGHTMKYSKRIKEEEAPSPLPPM